VTWAGISDRWSRTIRELRMKRFSTVYIIYRYLKSNRYTRSRQMVSEKWFWLLKLRLSSCSTYYFRARSYFGSTTIAYAFFLPNQFSVWVVSFHQNDLGTQDSAGPPLNRPWSDIYALLGDDSSPLLLEKSRLCYVSRVSCGKVKTAACMF